MIVYDDTQTNDRLKRPRQIVLPITISYNDLHDFIDGAHAWGATIKATVTKVTASSELVDVDVESMAYSESELLRRLDAMKIRFVVGKIKNRVVGDDD